MRDHEPNGGWHVWKLAVDFAIFSGLILGEKHRVRRNPEDGLWYVEEVAAREQLDVYAVDMPDPVSTYDPFQ